MAAGPGLALKFTADTVGISRGMAKTEAMLGEITKSTKQATTAMRGLVAIEVGKVLANGFAAATRTISSAASSVASYVDSVRESAKELTFLAQQANTSERVLQRMAAATATVGIDQEKLSDILKDVNDRVGDFLQTGAGPMADFFEKIAPRVGLTVANFKNLSGPQALQLYVAALQKANLNQQEFTFYLEAIASDATRLIPLLVNNGRAMDELGKRAERLGIILATDQVRAVNEMNRALIMVSKTFEGIIGQVVATLAPAITDMANEFLRFVQGFQGVGGVGGAGLARAIIDVSLSGIETFLNITQVVGNALISFGEAVAGVAEFFASFLPSAKPELGGGGGGGGWGEAGAVEAEKFGDKLRKTLDNTANAATAAFARVRASLERPQRGDFGIAPRIPQRAMPGVVRGGADDPFSQFLRESRELMKKRNDMQLEEERKYRDALLSEIQGKQQKLFESEVEFAQNRFDKMQEINTRALEVSDIRTSGGISQFLALATGREDPALTEAKRQVRELQAMRQEIQNLGVLVEMTGVA